MIRLVFALLPLLLLLGCQSPPRGYLGSDIFEDVPAPRGAAYLEDKNESFSYRSRTFRSGRFVYTYQGSADEVIRFYKETMTAPPYSWTFEGEDGLREGSTRLTFTKDEDKAEIDVDRVPRRAAARPDNVSIVVRINHRR